MIRKYFSGFVPALGWLLITIVLFTLPGSDLPKVTWMNRLHVDKLVHVFLFAVLVWLFFRAIAGARGRMTVGRTRILVLTLLAAGIIYGLSIEFIQKDFIRNRSFDLWDVMADAVGSLIGLSISLRKYLRPQGSEKS